MTEHLVERLAQLRAAITAQESLRPLLGDAAVDTVIATLRSELDKLEQQQTLTQPGRAERKPVTILFADLVGFTPLSEQTDPETVRQLMNACFDALETVVERYGGHVDKYIGDEIMVLFGAPVACEDHAERALRTALAMGEALQAFNAQLDQDAQLARLPPGFCSLELRIGINTGLVIAGGIGAQDHQQYSVIGDAVNVAARLTQIGQTGQILAGEETYRLTAPLFEFTALEPISLKGKRELQPVYQLHGLRSQPGRLRGLQTFGLDAPLIGRASEMALLQQAIAQLEAGHGSVIGIVGDAGVGKSRLVAELQQQVTLPWYEGRCLSYGEMLSYHLFLSLLRNLIGVSPEAELATLEAHLRRFLDDLLPDRAAQTYPYLADVLGLSLDEPLQERLGHLAGESRQWQAFQAFEEILTHLAHRAPTVVVMEDLHWADPTSLALLEQLLSLTDELPLLVLLIMRPFCGPLCQGLLTQLAAAPSIPHQELQLAPLSPTHSRELISRLLVIEALPEEVRQQILGRAEGNPLFLEEIIRALISQGVLERAGEHWRMAPEIELDQITIPPTLQGVILARLDRLEAETKSVLQMAAVIGRIFWYRVLDYVASVEQKLSHTLEEHLARMEQVELIRQTRTQPDLEYIFKHILMQEAAYHSLLREQRRRFHRQVAEALEVIFADSLEEQYGLLSRHYETAGEVERAIHYLRLAGDRARHAYALHEAEGYYRRALDLLPEKEDEARRRLLLDLGLVNLTAGDFSTAGELYATAFQLQQAHPQTLHRAYARRPLRVCWHHPPDVLEPGIPIDLHSAMVNQQLFAGLVEFDEKLNIIPHMAERWEIDAEGLRYRFHLRRDARWSDGTPLTAHDFVYAWRRWLHPDSGSAPVGVLFIIRGAADYYLGRVDDPTTIGVHARDDHTLEIELAAPVAYFLPMLTGSPFSPLPAHCWPAEGPPTDPTRIVTNGPFRLVEWTAGESLVLERNPHYAGITQGNVERVHIIFSNDPDTRVTLFTDDEVDVCWILPSDETVFTQRVAPERWQQKPRPCTFYLGLMPNVPPLDDRRVRQALVLATDRSRLAFGPLRTTVFAQGGFVPAGMAGHSPELMPSYAPDQARALLQEAGFADGAQLSPLQFVAGSSPQSPFPAAVFAQWQETLGIEVVTGQLSISELTDRVAHDPPHLFSMTWVADFADPHNFLDQGFLQRSVWRNDTYNGLVREAATTADVRQRMSLYHEMDRRLVIEEALCIPLAYGHNTIVMHPRVLYHPLPPLTHVPLKDVVMVE
ncbi:MAG: AAA family ATPase [Anaerolineae bacterium]|nr:AAA family ATPase [Anaerolineae bacterium]